MFESTCPKCGERMHGDPSTPCPRCSGAMTSIATPEDAVQAKVTPAVANDGAFREGLPSYYLEPHLWAGTEPGLFARCLPYGILATVVLTIVGLLVSVVQKVRAAAARTQSTKNLQKIGLAMHSFHDANKRLPFNGTAAAKAGDNTSGSWAFQILPFLDHKPLFDQPNTNVGVAVYMCPGRGRPTMSATGAWTDYFINPWLNQLDGSVNSPDLKRTLVSITDGSSNTIFVGHGNIDPNLYSSSVAIEQSAVIFNGGNPAMARHSTTNQADKSGDRGLHWGGPFAEGCLFCMCDATVRTFPYSVTGGAINNKTGVAEWTGLGLWLTPNGNDVLPAPRD